MRRQGRGGQSLLSALLASLILLTGGSGVQAGQAGDLVIVTAEGSHEIVFLDGTSRQIQARVPSGVAPHNLALRADGKLLLATAPAAGEVVVLDLQALRIHGRLSLGTEAAQLIERARIEGIFGPFVWAR